MNTVSPNEIAIGGETPSCDCVGLPKYLTVQCLVQLEMECVKITGQAAND